MTCPCESCKAERDLEKQRRAKRKQIAAWHKRQLQDIEWRIEVSKDAMWLSVKGPVRVQDMSPAHLFFALAKCYRGEYPSHTGVIHLENEAMRRLIARVR